MTDSTLADVAPAIKPRGLVRIETRALVALAIANGLKPARIIVHERSTGAGRARKLRPAFYFEPSPQLERILATDPRKLAFLRRYARALREYRELFDKAIASAVQR